MHLSRLLAATAAIASFPALTHAELIFGITVPGATAGDLVSFDSANPAGFSTVGSITGIVAGQTLRAIDFRPSNGLLYAMSSDAAGTAAQLYTINLGTAVASPVGAGVALTGNTSARVSIDFNPVVDAVRVVTGTGQNYRVNANTGALINQDTNISGTPLISGVAYNNNVVGATQTTLYAYDFITDNLGTIGGINGVPSPNSGQLNTIGNSGVVTGDAGLGLDISGVTGTAYASVDDFNGSAGFNAEFFTVDLSTGVFTQVGPDDVFPVLDISATVPEPASLGVCALAVSGLLARRRVS